MHVELRFKIASLFFTRLGLASRPHPSHLTVVMVQIVLSVAEHHSNTVPWHLLAKRSGAMLKHVTLTPDE